MKIFHAFIYFTFIFGDASTCPPCCCCFFLILGSWWLERGRYTGNFPQRSISFMYIKMRTCAVSRTDTCSVTIATITLTVFISCIYFNPNWLAGMICLNYGVVLVWLSFKLFIWDGQMSPTLVCELSNIAPANASLLCISARMWFRSEAACNQMRDCGCDTDTRNEYPASDISVTAWENILVCQQQKIPEKPQLERALSVLMLTARSKPSSNFSVTNHCKNWDFV